MANTSFVMMSLDYIYTVIYVSLTPKKVRCKFFILYSLFTQDYNVTSMRFIILRTYFTFTTTTKWRVDFRSKEKEKEKGNGNVGFSSILGRTIFH